MANVPTAAHGEILTTDNTGSDQKLSLELKDGALSRKATADSELGLRSSGSSSLGENSQEADEDLDHPRQRLAWCNTFAENFYAWLYPLSANSRKGAGGKTGGSGAPRLEALDAPRWIASIQIVCYHMYESRESFKPYATWFSSWTQLFFLLSGFILAYAELAKPPKVGSARPSLLRYVRRRLTVIYPAFFLSLLLKVAYAPGQSAFQWAMLPLHALLLQSWLPICSVTPTGGVEFGPWLYNGEAWFLSVLFVYWLTLRPLAEFFRRRSLAFSSVSLLACWLFSFVFQWLGHEDNLVHMLDCSDNRLCGATIMVAFRATPIGYFHVFIAGVAASRVFILLATRDADTSGAVTLSTKRIVLAEKSAPLVLRYGCCAGYLGYAVLVLFATDWIKTHYYFFHNGGLLPAMVLVLLGAAIGEDPITTWLFRSKPMMVLGRISYLQYLMQHVLQGWIKRAFGWQDNLTAQAWFIPALLVFSYFCQRWVEKPYTEYQRWRQEKGIKGCDDRFIDFFENFGARCMACLRQK